MLKTDANNIIGKHDIYSAPLSPENRHSKESKEELHRLKLENAKLKIDNNQGAVLETFAVRARVSDLFSKYSFENSKFA